MVTEALGPTIDPGKVRSLPERSVSSLVIEAKGGSASAQQALFRRFVGMTHALAWRLVPHEAEDIVQDAFAAAFEKLGDLSDPEAFPGWMRAVVLQAARRTIRRQRLLGLLGFRSPRPVDVQDLIGRSVPADDATEIRLVYSRLARFPVEVRLVLILKLAEGMTVTEIAQELHLSEPTVKRRLRRGEELLDRYRKGGSRS